MKLIPPENQQYGWRELSNPSLSIWISGTIYNYSDEEIATFFEDVSWENNGGKIAGFLKNIDGHFAIFVKTENVVFACVDRIRSRPVLYSSDKKNGLVIGCHAKKMESAISADRTVDPIGSLAVAMAGYCIANDTIYEVMKQLSPGQYILAQSDSEYEVTRYDLFSPWQPVENNLSRIENEKQLSELTLNILKKVITAASGREIVIPLSAGYDSRLIASGLFALGYRNVKCFSYGVSGNFESEASKKIAEKLEYPWRFVSTDNSRAKKLYNSEEFREFLDYTDDCASCYMVQDFVVLKQLLEDGWISTDSIIINGNSGDFQEVRICPILLSGAVLFSDDFQTYSRMPKAENAYQAVPPGFLHDVRFHQAAHSDHLVFPEYGYL